MARVLLSTLATFTHKVSPIQLIRTSTAITHAPRYLSTTRGVLSERKYTEKHEWVAVDGKIGTIGITNYAQEALGDIVYIQLPEVGTEFEQMEECGVLESVKAASDLFTPVSGKVTEINSAIEDRPELLNISCYDEGWLFKLELTVPSELDGLMDEAGYENFLQENKE
ncbi:hypothetical protein Pcinc_017740 [Petrolisthes cinctipes]|uniref:Glycine cleavage system H protein n=1 Tax=Petrolisthes cinctipes TaxID=88211 RepID=A0AAE1KMG3_PETCI|nr:hypothetical protein Pcinc_017740 [Petrolisthes cinctipes]